MAGFFRATALTTFAVVGLLADDFSPSGINCSFRSDPDHFLAAQARAQSLVHQSLTKLKGRAAVASVDPASIPHQSFIDDEIFNKMATQGVNSAPLSSDEEFFRRINLDLTGRIPAPADVRAFVADADPDKRNKLVDKLVWTPEFVDKWAIWMGDWLRNSATSAVSNSPQQITGRNAFYKYIWASLSDAKSIKDIAVESVMSYGNNFDESSGNVNFISSMLTPGGPAQDTYDAMLVKSATTFLGVGNYDCVLCHNGRGHLDALSLWGKNTTRMDAEKMAAFFARTNVIRWAPTTTTPAEVMSFYTNSYYLDDVKTRTYDLNTNYGNRPNRVAQNGVSKLTPVYRDSAATPATENWRAAFADNMIKDPMFKRNIVNRVWKQLFNLALADPVDGLDPARLDPANAPADGWDFQATHPQLLERLAGEFGLMNFDLRSLVKLMVKSNAYQLSSRYSDDWNIAYVPLFARHYPRRLDGEEVHDAVAKSTGIFANYTQQGWGTTVKWAMQLLDPVEPRSNGTSSTFMNYFLRGNRDTTSRSQAVTMQQQLALMNDSFVTPKLKMNASTVLQAIAKLPTTDAIAEEMFLTFISRKPDDLERTRALAYLNKATTTAQKNAAIEDLAWVLVNKVDFLYSY